MTTHTQGASAPSPLALSADTIEAALQAAISAHDAHSLTSACFTELESIFSAVRLALEANNPCLAMNLCAAGEDRASFLQGQSEHQFKLIEPEIERLSACKDTPHPSMTETASAHHDAWKMAKSAANHACDTAALADSVINDLGYMIQSTREALRQGAEARAESLFKTLDYLINDWQGLLLHARETAAKNRDALESAWATGGAQ